ncbi:FAD-binding oxidoreductase [Conexibacter woesei]|uniref:FAD-binding oxidoreductase n=1 Tax=Conexibacter woesei TaxID=191495 RepID=UPI00040732DA|nr:FAD-linked oxidase C-terminal domain-containing protein [Conexibacter woesei]
MPDAAQQTALTREAALAGVGELITDPDVLASYRHDQAAPGLLTAGTPAALARPTTTAEVQAAVIAAGRAGVPVVPRGAGSGLSGGANAIDGCLVVSLERLTRIADLDPDALTATVEAGVVNHALRDAAAAEGLRYAPDPASFEFSTIGGNVATNAGGLCCVKYGVTRDALLALEVVTAQGEVLQLGHATRKGVTGYDLTALVCGSEGTLAIVTQATVRLLPTPPAAHTLAASFSRLDQAGDAIAAIVRRHRPAMLELMDRTTIAAVEALAPMDLDLEAEAMVFARSDAGRVEGAEEIAAMARLCEQAGANLVLTTDEEAEGRMLMAARRLAYSALERQGTTLLDDVCVPIPTVPALLRGVEEIARRAELTIGTFGHAGDGNMHPTVVYDHTDPDQLARAREAFDAILELALELGGTVTGEHGVGLLKREAAARELGASLHLHRAVKQAFDPDDLLNPDKVPWHVAAAAAAATPTSR